MAPQLESEDEISEVNDNLITTVKAAEFEAAAEEALVKRSPSPRSPTPPTVSLKLPIRSLSQEFCSATLTPAPPPSSTCNPVSSFTVHNLRQPPPHTTNPEETSAREGGGKGETTAQLHRHLDDDDDEIAQVASTSKLISENGMSPVCSGGENSGKQQQQHNESSSCAINGDSRGEQLDDGFDDEGVEEDAAASDDEDDDEEEEEILEEDDEEASEDSWSPSPIPEDDPPGLGKEPDKQHPTLDEKDKVTEQFMKDLIMFFKNGQRLPRHIVIKILTDSKLLFMGQSSLVDISLSKDDHLNVCGDIHGQFFDLANIFDLFGFPTKRNQYLFNGDFVDRGVWSVEVMLVLLGFKLLLPDTFFLVRGNHESEEVNRVYGFENEVLDKYDGKIFRLFQNVFDWLPVTHCVNSSVLIMHGGLPCSKAPRSKSSGSNGEQSDDPSDEDDYEEDEDDDLPATVTLDDIRSLRRGCPVPKQGLMCDLLWADPREENGTAPNSRGYSSVFGPDITRKFLADNNLLYIVRSHECVQPGFDLCHDDTVVTVFSAPNYCDRQGNKGAVCILHGDDVSMPEFRRFKAVPHPKVDRHKYNSIYMRYGLI